MKISERIKLSGWCALIVLVVMSCEPDNIVDFGFDGAISGTLQDANGNVVPGNITTSNLVVRAQGEGDQVTIDMRVNGDGTYQNTKLYPKRYKIWVAGPVTMATDTLVVDFSKEKTMVRDLEVTPFVSISQPVVVGSVTTSAVDVGYSIVGNNGKAVSNREVYCSTNPYPDASTGSGPFFETKKITLPSNEGNVSITGLKPQTRYFIRIGAQATGATGFNYSEQIVITTP